MRLNQTIHENFFAISRRRPHKKALLFKQNNVYFPIKYDELAYRVRDLAAALQKIGLKKGDRLAILANNRPEWVISDLATLLAGGVVVPVHATLSPKIINHVLNHSHSKILVVSDLSLLNKVLFFQNDLPALEKIIFLEELDDETRQLAKKEIIIWAEAMALGRYQEPKPVAVETDDLASIIYTSGTTGLPKGVMLTHSNFLSNAYNVNSVIPVKADDVFLSFLPLSHVLERLAGYYMPLLFGATIAYAEGYKQLPYNLRQVKPTILIAVPRVFERFYDIVWDNIVKGSRLKRKLFYLALQQNEGSWGYRLADRIIFKKVRTRLGGRLRLAISGGASLDAKIAKFFHKMGVLILEGYGTSETSPVVAVNPEDDFCFGTVGYAIPNTEIRISDDKEILVKGPNVMAGYYQNDEETELVLDHDGWYHTGDLGFLDLAKRLVVIGRKKEMMVTSGGKNVWPEPLEQRLNIDRFISQSAAVAHGRKFVAALIVPDWQEVELYFKQKGLPVRTPQKLLEKGELNALFEERLAKINEDLSDYEKIRKFKLLINEFSQERDEMTPTLKLRRQVIDSHYQKEIEEIYR